MKTYSHSSWSFPLLPPLLLQGYYPETSFNDLLSTIVQINWALAKTIACKDAIRNELKNNMCGLETVRRRLVQRVG